MFDMLNSCLSHFCVMSLNSGLYFMVQCTEGRFQSATANGESMFSGCCKHVCFYTFLHQLSLATGTSLLLSKTVCSNLKKSYHSNSSSLCYSYSTQYCPCSPLWTIEMEENEDVKCPNRMESDKRAGLSICLCQDPDCKRTCKSTHPHMFSLSLHLRLAYTHYYTRSVYSGGDYFLIKSNRIF